MPDTRHSLIFCVFPVSLYNQIGSCASFSHTTESIFRKLCWPHLPWIILLISSYVITRGVYMVSLMGTCKSSIITLLLHFQVIILFPSRLWPSQVCDDSVGLLAFAHFLTHSGQSQCDLRISRSSQWLFSIQITANIFQDTLNKWQPPSEQ